MLCNFIAAQVYLFGPFLLHKIEFPRINSALLKEQSTMTEETKKIELTENEKKLFEELMPQNLS